MEKSEADAMKERTETASVPSKVGGMDGEGWRNAVLKDPMRTTPAGAAFLIVNHYEALMERRLKDANKWGTP